MTRRGTTEIDAIVGRNVQAARERRGVKRGALAKAIGVSCQQMHNYEYARQRMAVARLIQIAEVLQVQIDDLLAGTSCCSDEPAQPSPASSAAIRLMLAMSEHQQKRALDALTIIAGIPYSAADDPAGD